MTLTIQYEARCLDFPQELSDHVFEILRNDSSSLKHCSLVCRAWLHATRSHLFRQVILTPNNIVPFTFLIIDSRSTVHSHVRKLELRRINYSAGLLANFTSTLTHLHLRDMSFNTVIDILDIICSLPYLQSVALDELTVETGFENLLAHIQKKILPPTVNSVRCRGGSCVRTFLLWLLHHNSIPKLSGLDVGPIKEESTFEIGKYIASAGPAVKHLSLSFDFGHNTHTCALEDYGKQMLSITEHTKANVFSIAERYKALFGLDVCPNLGSLTGLQSLRLDNFIHFEDRIKSTALVWAPRIIASGRANELREVVLGITLQKASQLDAFNIHWEFFDEAFATMVGPYANLVSLTFVVAGQVNVDGIASLIRSRLPGCEKRGLLQFCREGLLRRRQRTC